MMARFLKVPSKCDVTSRKSGSHKLRNVKRHQLSSRKSTTRSIIRRTLNAWSEESMANAIAEYTAAKQEGKECGLRRIARAYGIPRSTLERRVNGKVAGNKHASGRHTAFTQEEESELCDLLTSMARRGFPLREREVRTLATDYATKNELPIFSKSKSQHAGYFWLQGFLKRHPELKVKRAEGLSAARAQAVNEAKILNWFEELERMLKNANVLNMPAFLWNLDESGLQDVFQSKRAIGESGKQLYQVQAGDKGDTTTIVPVFNALGTVATLMVIFKGARLKPEFCVGSPSNTILKCSSDGWINKELFYELGVSFVRYLKSQNYAPQQKHVLLLDGHGSHVYNVDFLKMMAANNVEVFCFPPHTSHILQPADVSLFKSLKSNWTAEGLKFTRETGGKKVGRQHFFQVFTPAWERSSSTENIQAGFRKTGIFPFNQQAIPKCAFLPSLTTERRTEEPLADAMPVMFQDVTLAGDTIASQQQKPSVSHTYTQTLDVTQLNEQHSEQEGCVAVEEEPLHISSLNTSLNNADLSIDIANVSLGSLMDISMSDLIIPEVTVTSASSDGLIAVTSMESAPPQNVCQLEITLNTSDANTPHEVTDQFPGHDTLLVECELNKGDAANGSPANTSNQAGDMSVAINHNTTAAGVRTPFSALCDLPQRVKSERKRKKPPSYCLTSVEHMEYITPQKKTKKKTQMTGSKQKNKVQLKNQEPSKMKAVKNGMSQQKPSRGKENKEKAKRKKSVATNSQDDHMPCYYCGKQYDTPGDDKCDEEWLSCGGCTIWAHESCAETNGIIDEAGNGFLCKSCCD